MGTFIPAGTPGRASSLFRLTLGEALLWPREPGSCLPAMRKEQGMLGNRVTAYHAPLDWNEFQLDPRFEGKKRI